MANLDDVKKAHTFCFIWPVDGLTPNGTKGRVKNTKPKGSNEALEKNGAHCRRHWENVISNVEMCTHFSFVSVRVNTLN